MSESCLFRVYTWKIPLCGCCLVTKDGIGESEFVNLSGPWELPSLLLTVTFVLLTNLQIYSYEFQDMFDSSVRWWESPWDVFYLRKEIFLLTRRLLLLLYDIRLSSNSLSELIFTTFRVSSSETIILSLDLFARLSTLFKSSLFLLRPSSSFEVS